MVNLKACVSVILLAQSQRAPVVAGRPPLNTTLEQATPCLPKLSQLVSGPANSKSLEKPRLTLIHPDRNIREATALVIVEIRWLRGTKTCGAVIQNLVAVCRRASRDTDTPWGAFTPRSIQRGSPSFSVAKIQARISFVIMEAEASLFARGLLIYQVKTDLKAVFLPDLVVARQRL